MEPFRSIVSLFTRRNYHPTSFFEKIGDALITPFAFAMGILKFRVIRHNNSFFIHECAEDHSFINTVRKLAWARLLGYLLVPFALIGFLIKLPGLFFSKEMRQVYFNWTIPVPLEYKYLVFKDDADRASAKLYNNLSIIDDAIRKQVAVPLMIDIKNNVRQWLVNTPGSDPDMSLSPKISECVCYSDHFNRFKNSRRLTIEEEMSNYLELRSTEGTKEKTLTYLSLGADGFLQELMNIFILLSHGYDLDLCLVDRHFGDISEDRQHVFNDYPIPRGREEKSTELIALIQAMAKELGQTVHLQFFNDLSTFNIDQKFDVISAIDFDDLFGRHNGYTAVCEAYTHLKEGGRLYLSYDTKNFIYDSAGCIVSNMKDEALQLHPSSESTPQVRYIPFTTRLSDTARKWAPMLGTSRTPSRLSFWRNDVDEEQDLFDRDHPVLSGSAPTAF